MGYCGRARHKALRLDARAFPVIALLGYLAASIFVGALVAFPVYAALREQADPAFDSVLHRVGALTLLLLLPLYLASARFAPDAEPSARPRAIRAARDAGPARSLDVSMSLDALGFGCSRRSFARAFGGGFVLGMLVVSPLVAAFVVLGVRAPVPSISSLADMGTYLAYALVAAIVIGSIEEAYFRGALLAPLRRALPGWLAVCIVAAVYAVMHFLGAPLAAEEPRWTSGLTSIWRSEVPLDSFLALVAAGIFLGALRLRFGHIAVGAGFHAGWVWIMKLNQEYTDIVPGSEWSFVAGSFGGTMGYLGLAWIALLGSAWLLSERITSRSEIARSPIAPTR